MVAVVALWLIVLPRPSAGYDEAEVKNGGVLTGTVTVTGEVPPPPVVPVYLFPFATFCEKISDAKGNIKIEEFTVSSDGGLQDTIITIDGIEAGKPFPDIDASFFCDRLHVSSSPCTHGRDV